VYPTLLRGKHPSNTSWVRQITLPDDGEVTNGLGVATKLHNLGMHATTDDASMMCQLNPGARIKTMVHGPGSDLPAIPAARIVTRMVSRRGLSSSSVSPSRPSASTCRCVRLVLHVSTVSATVPSVVWDDDPWHSGVSVYLNLSVQSYSKSLFASREQD
jgi:hypothetical protein